ncbi:T9SS type A sorting domain-containing protein [Aequorivita sp. CIP111184]|uniref:T9SS type A sorting domain-containing protein n=1 Tax=Aequorivita sp. CIP111184 TaxID=2211356 RepID=UPI000DBBF62D|nr:T9SS type A sorting domain-containing protein [Aequorivita sp. CIP111184]SRX55407.1 hypothetical protein AEQU1_02429 [Aequorivita sp. CIP111184]
MKTTIILKQLILLLALCFSISFNAQDVYVAGYDNDGSSSNIAQIWHGDGSKHDLTNGNSSAQANDVFIYNGNEYVAGNEDQGNYYVAMLWKNGIPQNLTNGNYDANAEAVFVYNDDVYVAGYQGNGTTLVAELWKNGNVQYLDESNGAFAKSVFVVDDDVYVAGYGTDGSNVFAKIWKNGDAQNLNDGSDFAEAESVFVFNNDVYVAGYQYNGTSFVATLWKNGNTQNLTDGSSDAYANSVFVYNNDVYVAGYDGTEPKLWKNGVVETLNYNGNLDGGQAYSVYVSGNDIYVSGTLQENNGNQQCNFAALWKNGQVAFTSPSPACTDDTAMYSVFVDDGQLGIENNANPQNNIVLSPNPVQEILHLETKTNNIQEIALFSITGQRLKTWEGKSEINLAQFATGSYFLKITTGDGQNVTKQIVKN